MLAVASSKKKFRGCVWQGSWQFYLGLTPAAKEDSIEYFEYTILKCWFSSLFLNEMSLWNSACILSWVFFLSVLQYLREQPCESLCTFDHFKVSLELEKRVFPFIPKEILAELRNAVCKYNHFPLHERDFPGLACMGMTGILCKDAVTSNAELSLGHSGQFIIVRATRARLGLGPRRESFYLYSFVR